MKTGRRLGVIVNPIAGMGGRVGLKGTDGDAYVRAVSLGAAPESPKRAVLTLRAIAEALGDSIEVLTGPDEMGESAAREAGLRPRALGHVARGDTTANDTIEIARQMMNSRVDLLLFVGGDGTARDVSDAIGLDIPVVGIPAGVKMHSAVYAHTPRAAAELAIRFLRNTELPCLQLEVMDIDETAFRDGRVSACLFGYLMVPFVPALVQGLKVGSQSNEKADAGAIGQEVVDRMSRNRIYILGPGTTTRAIADALGIPKTLLGVDVIYREQLLCSDARESDLLEVVADQPAEVIVSPIGGQGFIFGRGNQQISPSVIRRVGRSNITVVATNRKMSSLAARAFQVDTGDPSLDQELAGYVRVINGYRSEVIYPVKA